MARAGGWGRREPVAGNLPVAGVGTWPLCGTSALTRTNKTPKPPRTVPEKCGAPRIGGPVASAEDWRASGKCRALTGQWQVGFRACQMLKHSASHVLEVLGVLLVLVCPLENEIPCGRPAHWKRLGMNGNLSVAGVGTWPLRGTSALTRTNKTPKTPRTVPEKCGAPRIGGPDGKGRDNFETKLRQL